MFHWITQCRKYQKNKLKNVQLFVRLTIMKWNEYVIIASQFFMLFPCIFALKKAALIPLSPLFIYSSKSLHSESMLQQWNLHQHWHHIPVSVSTRIVWKAMWTYVVIVKFFLSNLAWKRFQHKVWKCNQNLVSELSDKDSQTRCESHFSSAQDTAFVTEIRGISQLFLSLVDGEARWSSG